MQAIMSLFTGRLVQPGAVLAGPARHDFESINAARNLTQLEVADDAHSRLAEATDALQELKSQSAAAAPVGGNRGLGQQQPSDAARSFVDKRLGVQQTIIDLAVHADVWVAAALCRPADDSSAGMRQRQHAVADQLVQLSRQLHALCPVVCIRKRSTLQRAAAGEAGAGATGGRQQVQQQDEDTGLMPAATEEPSVLDGWLSELLELSSGLLSTAGEDLAGLPVQVADFACDPTAAVVLAGYTLLANSMRILHSSSTSGADLAGTAGASLCCSLLQDVTSWRRPCGLNWHMTRVARLSAMILNKAMDMEASSCRPGVPARTLEVCCTKMKQLATDAVEHLTLPQPIKYPGDNMLLTVSLVAAGRHLAQLGLDTPSKKELLDVLWQLAPHAALLSEQLQAAVTELACKLLAKDTGVPCKVSLDAVSQLCGIVGNGAVAQDPRRQVAVLQLLSSCLTSVNANHAAWELLQRLPASIASDSTQVASAALDLLDDWLCEGGKRLEHNLVPLSAAFETVVASVCTVASGDGSCQEPRVKAHALELLGRIKALLDEELFVDLLASVENGKFLPLLQQDALAAPAQQQQQVPEQVAVPGQLPDDIGLAAAGPDAEASGQQLAAGAAAADDGVLGDVVGVALVQQGLAAADDGGNEEEGGEEQDEGAVAAAVQEQPQTCKRSRHVQAVHDGGLLAAGEQGGQGEGDEQLGGGKRHRKDPAA